MTCVDLYHDKEIYNVLAFGAITAGHGQKPSVNSYRSTETVVLVMANFSDKATFSLYWDYTFFLFADLTRFTTP